MGHMLLVFGTGYIYRSPSENLDRYIIHLAPHNKNCVVFFVCSILLGNLFLRSRQVLNFGISKSDI